MTSPQLRGKCMGFNLLEEITIWNIFLCLTASLVNEINSIISGNVIILMVSEIRPEKHKMTCIIWVVTLTAPMAMDSTCHSGRKPPLTDYSPGQWVLQFVIVAVILICDVNTQLSHWVLQFVFHHTGDCAVWFVIWSHNFVAKIKYEVLDEPGPWGRTCLSGVCGIVYINTKLFFLSPLILLFAFSCFVDPASLPTIKSFVFSASNRTYPSSNAIKWNKFV